MRAPRDRSFAVTITILSVSVTLFWTAIYYSFATMLPLWEAEENWDKTILTALFGGSVVLSALAAPAAGRLIDRGKGPSLVFFGGLWGVAVLVLAPLAPSLAVFAPLWISLGIAMAATLYEPVFAMLTRAYGAKARRAITIVTLTGALAGTIAFPLVHALGEIGGWHLAAWSLAALTLFVALPLHIYAALRLERLAGARDPIASCPSPSEANDVRHSTGGQRRTLAILSIAFALAGASHGLIVNHILPIMDDFGFADGTAILAASMIGPMQLLARLSVLGTERRTSARGITIASFAALSLSALCLLGSAAFPFLLAGFALLQGYGYGSVSIMRPVLLRESAGEAAFGEMSGKMARVYISAVAAAPLLGSLLWRAGGYSLALLVAAVACLGSMVLVRAIRPA